MTRRISKHGTLYTEGSSSTPTADMPRICVVCGQRIYTSRQSFQHHVDHQRHTNQAWHTHCKGALTMETEPTTPTEPEPTDPTPDDGGEEGDNE